MHITLNSRRLALLIIVSSFILSACGGREKTSNSPTQATTTEFSASSSPATGKAPESTTTSKTDSDNATQSSADIQVSEQSTSENIPEMVSEYTVSPDGRHEVYLTWADGKPDAVDEEGEYGQMVVVVDGKKGTHRFNSDPHDKPIDSFIFSPDSKRLAYLAKGGHEVFVSDLEEMHLNLNDNNGNGGEYFEDFSTSEYDGIRKAFGLQFSPDSTSFAYVASHYSAAGPSYVVVNGAKGTPYPHILSSPLFSPDSKRLGFVIRADNPYGDSAVVDGQVGKRYVSVDTRYMAFSPDSKRFAYIAGTGQDTGPNRSMEYFVVIDGQEGKHYKGIGDYLKFSPDSEHIAYAAKIGERKWAVIIDGKERMSYDAGNILMLDFSADSKQVSYLVSPQLGVRGDEIALKVEGDSLLPSW